MAKDGMGKSQSADEAIKAQPYSGDVGQMETTSDESEAAAMKAYNEAKKE